MSLLKKIGIVVFALTLLISGTSTTIFKANAQSNNANTQPIDESVGSVLKQMNNTASKTSEMKNPKKIQHLTDISKAAISSKQVVLNYSNADLDFDGARFLEIKEKGEKYSSVTIPIVGGQYSLISNSTLIFDSENKIISYSETLITKSDNDMFVVTSYTNGELIQEEVTDIDYISNSELQKELDYMQNAEGDMIQAKRTFSQTVLCISTVALIDLTIARLIAVTCVASCPAIPPICAACIAAVAVVGASNIGAIMACFK